MIDEKRIADFFAELVSIDSPSLEAVSYTHLLRGLRFTGHHLLAGNAGDRADHPRN